MACKTDGAACLVFTLECSLQSLPVWLFSISELLLMFDLIGNMNPQLVGYRITMTRSPPYAQITLKESFLVQRDPTYNRFFSRNPCAVSDWWAHRSFPFPCCSRLVAATNYEPTCATRIIDLT